MKILLADDSKTSLSFIKESLQELGHEVLSADSGQEALDIFKKQRPDLIILDVVMEGMNGFECAKNIRNIIPEDWIPIIFLSASVDDESISKGIDAGGDDYLTKPVSEITLAAKIKAMQRISDMRKDLFEMTEKLRVISSTDPLTGIYNRFQFNKTIVEKISQARRYKRKLALFYLDLDKFKLVNDTLGHQLGDLLLSVVTKRLLTCLRKEDFLARLGGDEFAIILSDLEEYENAGVVAEKILKILAPPYVIEELKVISSFSIGIACFPRDGRNPEELLKNADTAMYIAKKTNRNNYKYFNNKTTTPALRESEKEHVKLTKTASPILGSKFSVLHARVNDTPIAIALHFIEKILPLAQLEIMPNSPDYLVGLLNLAHKTLPVIDMGKRLNLNRDKNYTLETPILLCTDGFRELGIIVDGILGLEEVSLQQNEYLDEQESIILATPTISKELALLINMKLLFTSTLNYWDKDRAREYE